MALVIDKDSDSGRDVQTDGEKTRIPLETTSCFPRGRITVPHRAAGAEQKCQFLSLLYQSPIAGEFIRASYRVLIIVRDDVP